MPITKLEQVLESRLTWPETKPRASHRRRSPFQGREVATEHRAVENELQRWGIRQFIVSRNNQRIYAGDPGVAVWWNDKKGELRVLACDRWDKLADNMRAIHLTLDAMRALERWGAYTAEQAAEGAKLKALPPPDAVNWRDILGMLEHASLPKSDQLIIANRRYRDKSAELGAPEVTLNLAIEQARKELAA